MIYNYFKKAQEANVYEIKSRRLRSQKVVGTESLHFKLRGFTKSSVYR